MFKTLSLTIFCCLNFSLVAEDITLKIAPNKGACKTLSIPVPAHFMQLQKTITTEQTFYEFIPEGENAYMWNEIITIIKAPHNGQSLDEFVQNLGNNTMKTKINGDISLAKKTKCQSPI